MKPRSPAIACEGYIGLPGSGKTYALACRGLDAMAAGRRVFSNFGLRGSIPIEVWDHDNIGNTRDPGPPCTCGRCFVSISDAVILVDEINLWAPSRMWNAFPMALLMRWAQVRKYRTQILWSAQHEDRVDKAIRELTGYIWECQESTFGRWFHWVPFVPTFRLKCYAPSDLRKIGARPIQAQGLKLRAGAAGAYDTFEIVNTGSQFAPAPSKRRVTVGAPVAVLPPPNGEPSLIGADPWTESGINAPSDRYDPGRGYSGGS